MALTDLKRLLPLTLPESKRLSFYQVGANCIDSICGGIPKKHITVITGSSGCGKSMILMNMSILLAKNNPDAKIAYLSYENDISIDSDRTISIMNYYNISKIDNLHYYNIADYTKDEAMEYLHDIAIGVVDQYNLIVIDGTELLVSEQPELMHQEGEKFQALLKEYSTNFDITFLISWQNAKLALTKKFKDLSIADMSGSSALATRAGLVLTVGYEYISNKRQNEIRCLKSRCGIKPDGFEIRKIGCWSNSFCLDDPEEENYNMEEF